MALMEGLSLRDITYRRWIGLYGPAQAGKDTLARVLVHDYGYKRIAFADPVKEMALAIDPIVDANRGIRTHLSEVVNGAGWESAKADYPEIRRILQRIGTEAVRKQTPSYWVDLAEFKANVQDQPVVFTDVRFPNEAQMVKRHDGLVVKIDARTVLETELGEHASENSMCDWTPDFVLHNPRTSDFEEIARRMRTFASALQTV